MKLGSVRAANDPVSVAHRRMTEVSSIPFHQRRIVIVAVDIDIDIIVNFDTVSGQFGRSQQGRGGFGRNAKLALFYPSGFSTKGVTSHKSTS